MKRYGCLFTCFATLAVHLEVCNGLMTASFLSACFLCSRGFAITQIWNDNGNNMIGTDNKIKDAVKKIDGGRLCEALYPGAVESRFSPPRSQHQSGVWEVMVREAKISLCSTYTENCYRVLNDEKFVPYVKEIEAILNCRPLIALSDDLNDFSFLSPMLILNTCLEPSLRLGEFLKADGLRTLWKTAQNMAHDFWRN